MTAAGIDGLAAARRRPPARRMPRVAHPFAWLLLAGVACLVLAPLVSLVAIALKGDAEIWPHLVAYVLPHATLNTVLLLLGVATLASVAGVGTAWIVTAYEFPGRGILVWLLPLPLAFPTYIVAYVYVDILDSFGPVQTALRALVGWTSAADHWFPPIKSLGGAIFVMGVVLYPYVYLATRAMFQTQSGLLIEMARSLGASKWRLARDITLPLARPAIAAGLALAMLEALNDIGASEYLGVRTLTLSIFDTWLNRSSLPGAAQIACFMLIVVGGLIALERYGRRRQQFTGHDRQPGMARRIVLQGGWRWIAPAACATPVALGFILPLAYLTWDVIVRAIVVGFDVQLIRHTWNTVLIAACATVVTLALGFGAAFAVRLIRRPAAGSALFVSGMGYAVPGTVLALGLLSPLVLFDGALAWLVRLVSGVEIGLLLAGSSAAVVVAYAVRFMAIATGFAQAGLSRISTDLDDAARAAGTSPSGVVRSIQLPLMRPAIWGAALLIFVDCLKELPATLMLRPLNVETLSTYIYQFATRGSFEDGALAALLIVLVGIVPVIRMMRHADEAVQAR